MIPDYTYANFGKEDVASRHISLAAFAQKPPSALTACIGVMADQTPCVDDRDLGAPVLIEVVGERGRRWKNTPKGPVLLDTNWIPLDRLISANSRDWAPERIFRAKSIGPVDVSCQLDFVDLGLLPAIEKEARSKLDALMSRVVRATTEEFRKVTCGQEIPEELLYRLVFKLITAKLLKDRRVLNGLDFSQPRRMLEQVQNYSPSESLANVDDSVLCAAASEMASSFPFSNIGVDTLAYVYENTMLTSETRRRLSVHLTPSYLADYMLARLPLTEMPLERIMITDPMCGHGTFLLAGLRSLRMMLLSTPWSPEECHRFFLSHIRGRDIDPFAVEVTRLSMTLADLPHPNGWDIQPSDIYEPDTIEGIARDTTVLLTNPPFEKFDPEDHHILGRDITKPAELILRTLPSLPDDSFVGLVLPLAFLEGQQYATSRHAFKGAFDIQEILVLPDKVFSKADAEVAVVLARKRKHPTSSYSITYRKVAEKDFPSFVDSKLVSWEDRVPVADMFKKTAVGVDSLWLPEHYSAWRRLENLPKLGDFVEVHKGVEYSKGGKQAEDSYFPRSVRGVDLVGKSFQPFAVGTTKWISDGPRRGSGGSWDRPWNEPKILVNVAPRSRGPWRLVAARDASGLVATKRFFAIWRTSEEWPLAALVAVLNSAVANAFVFDHDGKRDIRRTTLRALPLPLPNPALLKILAELSLECESMASQSHDRDLAGLLLQIDSQLLKAYDLPPREERRLLDAFQGERRPGCRSFHGFYQQDFAPAIPLHMILSSEFQQARADRLLLHMPEVDDPEISSMLRHMLEAE